MNIRVSHWLSLTTHYNLQAVKHIPQSLYWSQTFRHLMKVQDTKYNRIQPPNRNTLQTMATHITAEKSMHISKYNDLWCGTCEILESEPAKKFMNVKEWIVTAITNREYELEKPKPDILHYMLMGQPRRQKWSKWPCKFNWYQI